MGFILLIVLSLLALSAAAALSSRFYSEGRAESALATLLYWLGLIVLPVHVLGWFDSLSSAALAISSASLSLLVGATALLLGQRRENLRLAVKALISFIRLPADSIVLAARKRNIAAIGLLAIMSVWLWTAWLVWLAPHNAWDGMLYHEPMVDYSIQNEGFQIVEASMTPTAQQVNSAPRLSSYLSIWFTIFTGRALIELTPHFFSILLVLGFFALNKRMTSSSMNALGFGCALFLVPTITLQLRSTYTDANFVGMFVVAAYYSTTKTLRARDILTAAIAIAMLVATKHTGLAVGPIFGLVVLTRVVLSFVRTKNKQAIIAAIAGIAIIAGLAGPTIFRNWTVFDNPIWPRKLEVASLGIDWRGISDINKVANIGSLESIFKYPKFTRQYVDSRDNGYGNGPPFIVLPIAVIGLGILIFAYARSLVRRRLPGHNAWRVSVVVSVALITLALSPSLYWGRYNGYAVAAGMTLTLWVLGHERWRDFTQAVMGGLIVTGLMTLHWSEPAWCVSPDTAFKMAEVEPGERPYFSLPMAVHLAGDAGRSRDREIGPGDVVAFSHNSFTATLWNESISNRVVYTPWRKKKGRFLDDLDEVNAKWVSVRKNGPDHKAVSKASKRWQRVEGPYLSNSHWRSVIYRRVSPK